MKIIIVVNIVGGQMPWQRTCPEPALPQWWIPPRGASGPRYALHALPADITTQLVPSILKYTSWKTLSFSFSEGAVHLLRNTRMGEGIGLLFYNFTIWLWHSGVFTINTRCQVWCTIELHRDPISNIKSALRVVKMVLNTQCYQYVWLTMWFHAKKIERNTHKIKIADFTMQIRLPSSEMTKNRQKKRITQLRFTQFFFYRNGIFWMPRGESSHPGGSEYVWQRGV